jgi:hypothetical protein
MVDRRRGSPCRLGPNRAFASVRQGYENLEAGQAHDLKAGLELIFPSHGVIA